jgi:2-polyprenyl-3-methyl-5-hydroxy-6-metoxy-1,4-benzoquinol methylase
MKQTPSHTTVNQELLALMPLDSLRVVEVGCMLGSFAQAYRQLNPQCHYTGIDIDADYANEAKKHCDVAVAADVENLDPDVWQDLEKADCWVFGDTLEHLRDPWKILRRINSNMKSCHAGSLVVCVPNAQHWSLQMRLNNGEFRYEDAGLLDRTHLRWFTRTTLIELFESTGFVFNKGIVRFLSQPAPEPIMHAIGKLAEASGADPQQAQEDAKVFQYVMQFGIQ